jgi:uncharacterized membrane protein YhhN
MGVKQSGTASVVNSQKPLFSQELEKHRTFILVFICLTAIELFVSPSFPHLRLLTKGAIVSSLLIYYILMVPPQNKVYILALIAALCGDLFLAIQKGDYFILGLGSFFIMQLLYISIFKRAYKSPSGQKLYLSLGIAAFYILFMIFSWSKLGDLSIPVAFYALALCSMLYLALNIDHRSSFHYIGWGALLFLISDFLIAINKFLFPIPFEHFFIMITYAVAQLFICFGLILSYERSLKK